MIPLPSFSWATGTEIWECMLEKDSNYAKLRSEKMLERHPSLVESYRTILLDWLSEVSHECKFHRETYHLALDFIDRYLTSQSNVSKLQLQLIGTTCLFLAAKFEEIRPPSVNEFADLTDGACKAEDIIENEIVILSSLNWEITPMTPNNWLNTFMQILLNLENTNSNNRNTTKLSIKSTNSFILPTTNGIFKANHKRIASVIDLALLHVGSLKFPNSILTASALSHFTDAATVRRCTGYSQKDLVECVRWLKPFVEEIKEIKEPIFIDSCRSETAQMHTHVATAKLLERAVTRMFEREGIENKRKTFCSDSESDSELLSPTKPTTLLTPPRSAKKMRI